MSVSCCLQHHQTYVTNLNAAISKFPELSGLGLVGLNEAAGTEKIPKDIATAIRCYAFLGMPC